MKKRRIMTGSAILLAVLLVAGGTFAWFTATAEPVVNEFKAGTVELDLKDNFYACKAQNVNPGDCYYKNVYVKNTGTKKARVRIELDGEFENGLPTDGVVKYDFSKGLFGQELWKDGGDGYLYYRYILKPGQSTDRLFKNDKVCFDGEKMGNEYQGQKFELTIGADMVQASNGAPEAVWGAGIPGTNFWPFGAEDNPAEFGLDSAPEPSEEMQVYMQENPVEVE